MKSDIQIYKGHIIHTPTKDGFTIIQNGYIIVEGTKVKKVTQFLPSEYQYFKVVDYGNKLIIPGLNDLHLHAPQFPNRGLCLDKKLIDWLFECTFPEEEKYSNLDYAKYVYSLLIKELWKVGTLRSLVYNTIHLNSTELLIDMFMQSGLGAYVGKVNMDIKAPPYIREDTEQSLIETEILLQKYCHVSPLVKPIIAPRFVPSCSPELLAGLGFLAEKYNAPVMSHLSEAKDEMEIVKEMYPTFPNYGSIYNFYGLFGQQPTAMAHCVYSPTDEIKLMAHNKVTAVHCPTSNCNLGSGMMPARKFLDLGVNIGLGCDVSGGGILNLLPVIVYVQSVSKMIWLYSDYQLEPITTSEAFYMATMGGGSFFGKIGCFNEGFEFDALVIDDSELITFDYTLEQRMDRYVHMGKPEYIIDRFISGKRIPEPQFD